MSIFPPLPIAAPLAAAALLAGLNRHIKRRAASWIAIAVTAAVLWFAVELLMESMPHTLVYWFGGWRPHNGIALGISFVIDPIGAGLALVAAALTLASLIFSSKYFDSIGTLFHVLMLVFLGAMCGFTLTGDLFNLFVFFELMSAAAYGLCGYKTEEPAPVQGALNFALTNTVGCYFVLTGIGLLYARTGALNLAQIGRALDGHPADGLVMAAFTFLTCGFFVKAAVAPFHFWLADAHAVAPTPVCVLFSGVMVELGIYAVTRIYWTVFSGALTSHAGEIRELFAGIGAVTALVGGAMCFGQRNLKRLLAFSTVSHVGLMVIGLGLFDVEGLAGTAFHVLGHAGAKAGLFLCAGIVLHRKQTVDEIELRGQTANLPATMALLVCAAAALAGIPASGDAVAGSLMDSASVREGFGWIRWISIATGVLTSGAILRFASRTYAGWGPAQAKEPEEPQKTEEGPETRGGHYHTPLVMFLPAAALTLCGLFAGLAPGLEKGTMDAARRFEDHAGYIACVLGGQAAPSQSRVATAGREPVQGAITVLAALALALLYLSWERGRHSLHAVGKVVRVIRDLHSGHIGDYIAWLTFGFAAFGIATILMLR